MSLFSLTRPILPTLTNVLGQPLRQRRLWAAGTFYRPIADRFDENCDPRPPLHPETPRFKDEFKPGPMPKGKIYDKKPIRMVCKADKVYWWCSCGHSKIQPLCDGHHKRLENHTGHYHINKIRYKPIKIVFDKDTEVWWCNCKQSDNRPFCDGTHRSEHIQSSIRY